MYVCLQKSGRLKPGRIGCIRNGLGIVFSTLVRGSLNRFPPQPFRALSFIPHVYTCQSSMTSLRRSARISSSASLAPAVPSTSTKAAKTPSKQAATQKRKASTPYKDVKLEEDPPRSSTPPPKKRRGRPSAADTTAAKSQSGLAESEPTESEPTMPATPSRSTSSSIPYHPATPKTPKTPKTPRPRHPAVNRLANPDVSNAMLISPETLRVVSALPLDSVDGLSAMSAATKATKATKAARTTTSDILDDACAHLIRVEPKMKTLIDVHYCKPFSPASLAEKVDPFESLASGIISQQVSGAAARAIKGRFVELFGDGEAVEEEGKERTFPQPSQVAAMSIERLRSAGLSQRKAEYLKGLGEKFVSGELSAQMLADAPYDTLVERLVAVRGLGLWSVEMFAMFGLKRMDVFSVGDLGVQRGMAAFAGRDVAKLKRAGSTTGKKNAKWKYMTDKEMVAMAEPFKPYRSVFMWYMWQVESVDVSSME